MFKLIQFSLDATERQRMLIGSEAAMRRAWIKAQDFALLTGACLHLQLINPRGQVIDSF